MKHWKKILLGAGLGFAAVKKIQASYENRSLSSLLVEDLLKRAPAIPDQQNPEIFKASFIKSSMPYAIPQNIQKMYGFRKLDQFADTWELNNRNNPNQQVIFYLHGGAYWSQPNILHYRLLDKLAKKLDACVFLPIYPKAPAYHAEDVHKMILERYRYLLETKKIAPQQITIMGDSAGAGLALAFLQVLRDQELPMPNQGILLSPWLDITTSNPDMKAIQPYDPLLIIDEIIFAGETYAGNLSLHNPLVSPIYGSSQNLPPLSVFCGTHEIFYADVRKYSDLAINQNLDIDFYIYEKMNHIFPLYPIPEAKDSLQQIIGIIKSRC